MTELLPLHFLIIDDDELTALTHQRILLNAGFKATVITSSEEALKQIPHLQPDCILSDLMMPQLDGHALFLEVKKITHIKPPKFILMTGKTYDFDRRRSRQLGVDGYLTKPMHPDHFVHDLLEIINERMTIQFWGVRGSLPVPGKQTTIYGGNTNCVSLSFAKREFFIFDGGTGIKELSNHLMRENHFPMQGRIFITHPHHDHIQGLPFFAPFYQKGNEFEILGANHGEQTMEELISRQMDNVYFPITMREFSANVSFRSLEEETFHIDSLEVSSIFLNHPGRCLGFKIKNHNKIFCYITDVELYLKDSPHYSAHEVAKLTNFIEGADLLVIDTAYSDEEYLKKIGWGHSCVSAVVDLAHEAKAKILCLYHHEPDEVDTDIDKKVEHARLLLKAKQSQTHCIAAHETDKIIL